MEKFIFFFKIKFIPTKITKCDCCTFVLLLTNFVFTTLQHHIFFRIYEIMFFVNTLGAITYLSNETAFMLTAVPKLQQLQR